MESLSLREFAVPMIKSIDSFNYLLKSHHRRVAIISYHIGKELGLDDKALFELVVAAALHDIGALSVLERDMLIKEDVENPQPHCIMGYRMLSSFKPFEPVAQIIKHHHIEYQDLYTQAHDSVPLASHIIHLADRVDILISLDEFILDQKETIIDSISKKSGIIFHPDIFDAFMKNARSDIFWFNINNWSIELLFRKLNFSVDFELTIDNLLEFSLVLSKIIDYRSRYTSAHSYTVAHVAFLIGEYMGFSEEKCQKLKIAGYLHDIGKLGIEPSLLEKPGTLNSSEFNIVKLHVYYTGLILNELSASEWFSEIVMWAERHHEKIDGNGYPYAIGEDALDQGVKILAYADIISALMEDRPYRNSLTIDGAMKIIRNDMAPRLSPNMFGEIEKHKGDIAAVVAKCQQHSFSEYSDTLDLIAKTSH